MGRSDAGGDGYSLEGATEPVPPKLPGIVEVAEAGEDILDLLTADMLAQALDCSHRYGSFHMAISGSEGLEPLCRRMMFDPDLRRFPWDRTHLWIADDRCVPRNDPLSCFWRLRDTLIMPAGIPLPHVHPIPSTEETADEMVEDRLRLELDSRSHGAGRLDCIVLDVDQTGRVGGLFPGDDASMETTRRVRFTRSTHDAYPHWVSLTLPVINASRMIAVLARGEATGQALHRVASCPPSVRDFPVVGLNGDEGLLKWYLDRDAAGANDETPD
ncbi:MAG: 6-phosphogluconolactonase [Phycisphaerales bacterium]|nr:6-phosphogluconolactonase [Phycisphaerales bacterium]